MAHKLWHHYSLAVILFCLFVVSWVGQGLVQWVEVANEARSHGQEPGLAEFVPVFVAATFENWQSEFLQLFAMVILTVFHRCRGSSEGLQNQEQMDRIERGVRELSAWR